MKYLAVKNHLHTKTHRCDPVHQPPLRWLVADNLNCNFTSRHSQGPQNVVSSEQNNIVLM